MDHKQNETKVIDSRAVRRHINPKSRLSQCDAPMLRNSHTVVEDKRKQRNRLSMQEMSNYILSPEPVPLDPCQANDAILEAAQRSNSSRAPSVITCQHDSQSEESRQSDRSPHEVTPPPPRRRLIPPTVKRKPPSRFSFRALFCCFSKQSPDHEKEASVASQKSNTCQQLSKPTVKPSHTVPPPCQNDVNLDSTTDRSQNGSRHPTKIVVNESPPDQTDASPLPYSTIVTDRFPHRSQPRRPESYPNTAATNHSDRVPHTFVDNRQSRINTPHSVNEHIDGETFTDESDQNDTVCYEKMFGAYPGINLLGDLSPEFVNKKCLVIDLDETLVHSWFKNPDSADLVVSVDIEGLAHQIFVCKRPFLDEFMEEIGPLFECVMFTASLKKYADPVCNFIDKRNHLKHRLFREHCVAHQANLVKDLSRLGRDVDQVCILDNSPVSFLFQPNNALHIISWFDDAKDTALRDLIPYFKALANSSASVVEFLRDNQPPKSAVTESSQLPPWLMLRPAVEIPDCCWDTSPDDEDEDDVFNRFDAGDDGVIEVDDNDAEIILSPHSSFAPPSNIPNDSLAGLVHQVAAVPRNSPSS